MRLKVLGRDNHAAYNTLCCSRADVMGVMRRMGRAKKQYHVEDRILRGDGGVGEGDTMEVVMRPLKRITQGYERETAIEGIEKSVCARVGGRGVVDMQPLASTRPLTCWMIS